MNASGKTLAVRVVDDVGALDALAGDWRRLAGEDAGTTVFNGWSWNRAWWSHYGHLGTLHVLVVSSGDAVVGIAPFYHTRSRLLRVATLGTLRFIGSGGDTSPDDLDVLAEPDRRAAVAEAVCERLLGRDANGTGERRIERFELRDLPADSAFASRFLARAAALGHVTPMSRIERRRVATLPESAAAWRAATSRSARKQRRRRLNRLAELGETTFALCETPADVEAAHAALVALHHARRASLGEAGGFSSSSYVGFHLALMHALLERGELRLGVLAIDDVPIAIEYAFAVHGTLAFFQTGFVPEQAKLAPSHLLMSWMIERAIEDGLRRIDLLKGDYDYKAAYADGWCETRTIDLCTRRWLARLRRRVGRLRTASS